MEKVLTQDEIDAMVRAARGEKPAVVHVGRGPKIVHCDFRQAGQIGKEQMRSINALHEGFARSLTHSLAAYLRIVFEATLVSAEHLTYREFLLRVPETCYLASIVLEPLQATAFLQLDLSIALPIIDLLLGGQGKGDFPRREVTEIEDQILETVVKIICRELQSAWQALALEFRFERRQQPSQMQRLMAPSEKILALSFEVTVSEAHGTLQVCFPAVVSNALLRKLSHEGAPHKHAGIGDAQPLLKRHLLDCAFPVELGVPDIPVRLGQLADLQPGQVLPLSRPATSPARVIVAGQQSFTATIARTDGHRAGRVIERLELSEQEKRQMP
ncbi:MAG TPA: FliM/FliN family flagellar motor switch protein [Candidatus Sulfotelmatobacter sp.]|nr:FliM/FliN family flagellar motor switch protein [Candidatus Sulfotelmatobacter sp.]